ncbi:MAG: hypothetical protein RLY70_3269 [Planctomycetota bacterium]
MGSASLVRWLVSPGWARFRQACCLAASLAFALAARVPTAAGAEPFRDALTDSPANDPFAHEVMAVLSRAGCNSGACHGNLNGKGGFKLSLRGQDPADDHRVLVRDLGGRRVNLAEPARSLLLLKATAEVAHQGGQRFTSDSLEYRVLQRWIGQGCPPSRGTALSSTAASSASASLPSASPLSPLPARLVALDVEPLEAVAVAPQDRVPLRATARFSDGSRRDVTPLIACETSNLVTRVDSSGAAVRESFGESTVVVRYLDQQVAVRVAFLPDRPVADLAAFQPRSPLDRLWRERWERLRVQPAPAADDATLVRRLSLDLLGVLPDADEAREFAESPSTDATSAAFEVPPDQRARLVDRMLARPEFADRWALAWSDVLRVEEKALDTTGVERFHGWIRQSIAQGKPLDQFVRELVVARGSTYQSPAANFYRSLRDPIARAETVGRLFQGVRLQCAQCHNHPFDRWTQDDYYQWTALFARVDYEIVENQRKDKLDKHEFVGDQIVRVLDVGEVRNPRTGEDAVPRFLGADTPEFEPNADRREPLADWLTSPRNVAFARTQANFIWYHLMGRGLVEPVDDLRPTNPPAHPGVLDHLAAKLVRDGFDLQSIVREVAMSSVYGLSAEPNETTRDDDALFARALVRRLPAEVLLDAQSTVSGMPVEFGGYSQRIRAGQMPGVRRGRDRDKKTAEGDRFLATFGKPQRLLACACERSDETTLKQALALLSDGDLQQRLESPLGRLEGWLRAAANTNAANASGANTNDANASGANKNGANTHRLVETLYWTALSRGPTTVERERATQWLGEAANDVERAAIFRDLAWALLNSKEFVFRH